MEIGMGSGYEGAPGKETGRAEELKGKASELTESARQRAMRRVDASKEQVCGLLDRVAGTVEDDRLGGYAAGYARRGAEYLRGRSADDLLASARAGLREKPAVMLSACFVAGLALARMLRR